MLNTPIEAWLPPALLVAAAAAVEAEWYWPAGALLASALWALYVLRQLGREGPP